MRTDGDPPSVFVAYPASPRLRAETMQLTADSLNSRGWRAESWERLNSPGSLILNYVTDSIKSSDAIIAEISSISPNVLFEVGYAIAQGKHIWLAFDDTDRDADKNWAGLGLMGSIGRINYGGSAESLTEQLVSAPREAQLLGQLLVDARPREANALFAPAVPTKFTAVSRLERFLARQSDFKQLATGDDLGLAPLQYYCGEIYRASAALLHLLGPSRTMAAEHNARVSLLAGFAHGFGLPVLMVAEEGFKSPIDYRDLLFVYTNTIELLSRVENWLSKLPTAGEDRRPGRLSLSVELPIRSFGQYVAENEAESLEEYFIETNEFRAVIDSRASVFLGRKGTGKTAAMTQATLELRRDRRVLVVPIKPTSYELSSLVDLIKSLGDSAVVEYLLTQLWIYLLTTEIAIEALRQAEAKPAGSAGSAEASDLAQQLSNIEIGLDDDFATRLDRAVQLMTTDRGGNVDKSELSKHEISRALRSESMALLNTAIRNHLRSYDRIAILIDNLDKTWEAGGGYKPTSRFLLALLSTTGRLEKNFARPTKGSPILNLTTAVFLRTDIYDVLVKSAREPDKINPQIVQWSDEELLARVLEERYRARRNSDRFAASGDVWLELFCPEVRGLPSRDYLLWRALPRPRDVIYLGNAALTRAINRKHDVVSADDITFAEKEYSKFAVDALTVESEAQGFDLLEILFEFAGMESTMTETTLAEILDGIPNKDAIVTWLLKTSFLGIEVAEGNFIHIEGEDAARRQLKVAERLAKRRQQEIRFRVHPAFRGYLEVRDDDLHSPGARGVSLEPSENPNE